MKKRTFAPIGLILSLALSACSQAPLNPPAVSLVADTRPVPIALGQAIALQTELSAGLSAQELEATSVASTVVNDPDGRPLYQLTLVGPEAHEFWPTAQKINGTEDLTLYATGAMTDRSSVSFIREANSLTGLKDALKKVGSLKEMVSVGGSTVFLVGQSGQMWDAWTGQAVSQQDYQKGVERFRQNRELRLKDGGIETVQKEWEAMLDAANGAPMGQQSLLLPPLKSLTLADGNLDVSGLTQSLTKNSQKNLSPQDVGNAQWWCEGWFCHTTVVTSAVRKVGVGETMPDYNKDNISSLGAAFREGDNLGNRQDLDYFPYSFMTPKDAVHYISTLLDPKLNNSIWGSKQTTGALRKTAVLGCVPLSVVRLFNWYGNHRIKYGYSNNINFMNTGSVAPLDVAAIMKVMAEPVYIGALGSQNVYKARIATYANTFTNSSGTDTSAASWDQKFAAANWIRDFSSEAANYEVRGGWGGIPYVGAFAVYASPVGSVAFSQYTWTVDAIVREKIARDNEPVLISYQSGPLSGHSTMSQAFITYRGSLSATVMAYVTPGVSDPLGGTYVGITDVNSSGAAWGIYKK